MSRQQERRRWRGMLDRCHRPRSIAYHNYGARGIAVCERWHDFENYYDDIIKLLGPCPEGMSIDRIDNDGNYEPSNVRWASHWQQTKNSRTSDRRNYGTPTVFYRQIAATIRRRIASGEYSPGAPIPSLRCIRQEASVSVKTAQQAIRILADEGLVIVQPGKGTFVTGAQCPTIRDNMIVRTPV